MMPGDMIRVLLVDDSPAFLAGAQDCLAEKNGLTVVGTASNGREALEETARLQPDLVLMDALMPEVDGFEATRNIKSSPDAPWVIIVTFLRETAVLEEVELAGADGVIVKTEFFESLDPLLAKIRSARRDDA